MGQSPRIGGSCRTASLLALLCIASYPVGGQTPGVTANEILIGSCSALEGPSHALGTAQIKGAEAYFDLINEEGGSGENSRGWFVYRRAHALCAAASLGHQCPRILCDRNARTNRRSLEKTGL